MGGKKKQSKWLDTLFPYLHIREKLIPQDKK